MIVIHNFLFLVSQQFNASSYGGLYGRADDDEGYQAMEPGKPGLGDCGGCSSPCTPKCVAEKGSRVKSS